LGAVLSVGDEIPLPASAGLAPGKVFFIVAIDSWYVAQAGTNNKEKHGKSGDFSSSWDRHSPSLLSK
jgi:hypothetical protein